MHHLRDIVSLVVIGHEIVDFEWNNGSSGPFHERAQGYLRGDCFFIRMIDEDTKIDIACRLSVNTQDTMIYIEEVHGLFTGMTSSEDMYVNLHMLKSDSDLRNIMTCKRVCRSVGARTHTHFDCLHVLGQMLRTLYFGYTIVWGESDEVTDARTLLNSVLGHHITLLSDGATHLARGVRRMVYM